MERTENPGAPQLNLRFCIRPTSPFRYKSTGLYSVTKINNNEENELFRQASLIRCKIELRPLPYQALFDLILKHCFLEGSVFSPEACRTEVEAWGPWDLPERNRCQMNSSRKQRLLRLAVDGELKGHSCPSPL